VTCEHSIRAAQRAKLGSRSVCAKGVQRSIRSIRALLQNHGVAKNSVDAVRQLRSPYTLEDVYTALRVLAFFGGNLRRATAALNETGIQVSKRTLERWSQRQYLDAYADAQAEVHRVAWQNSLARSVQVLAIAVESLDDPSEAAIAPYGTPARD
jgi:hypothetical protein